MEKYHIFVTSICLDFDSFLLRLENDLRILKEIPFQKKSSICLDFDIFLLRLENDLRILKEIPFQKKSADKFNSMWACLL